MIVIVLVAQGQSYIKRGLLQHLDSVPTPHLEVTVNTIVTSEDSDTQHQMSEVLITDPDGQGLDRTDEVEEADMRTNKEWKSESIA